jgi:hypothetical protein
MAKSKASRDREAARLERQLANTKPRPVRRAPPGSVGTTPRQPLSSRVQRFCGGISKASPVFLPLTNLDGMMAGQCHMNVLQQVRTHGGSRCNGWLIWEMAPFDEAIFHCAWQSPYGELLDITPRDDGEEYILFVPDPNTRLTRGARGGIMMPSARTTMPTMPFTANGQPYFHPFYELQPNAETLAYCAALGIDAMAVCD